MHIGSWHPSLQIHISIRAKDPTWSDCHCSCPPTLPPESSVNTLPLCHSPETHLPPNTPQIYSVLYSLWALPGMFSQIFSWLRCTTSSSLCLYVRLSQQACLTTLFNTTNCSDPLHPWHHLILPDSSFLLTCTIFSGLPGGTSGKEPACQCRRHETEGSTPGSRRSPGGRHGNPLQYSCLEDPMDRGAWKAIGPWGCKELDTTEET